jgi:glycosyltransferase involved in cell wall biosynthesis
MEYMASGKPVVMYKLDGIPDEYDKYLNYVTGSTSESLSNTIKYVLENLDEANQKASAARTFILKNKNSKKQVEKILDFLGNKK